MLVTLALRRLRQKDFKLKEQFYSETLSKQYRRAGKRKGSAEAQGPSPEVLITLSHSLA